jgi:[acyl-carrier-protein] S-malonyltransferase
MSNKNTALLFAGQGAQEAGMGRALAESNPEAMAVWKKAEKISGLPLRGIYWEGGENLDDTRHLQPALTAANLGLWLELSRRFKPAAAAGHSLGEYCALAAAGVLDLEETLKLVSLRGRLMAEADPGGKGGMAAIVKVDEAGAEALVAQVRAAFDETPAGEIRIANYNSPAQFVVSGSRAAIALLTEKARAVKARALPLAVSGAFHGPFMAEASRELALALQKAAFNDARFPVYCNVTGEAVRGGGEIKTLLLRQMTSPVRWIDTIRNMFADGLDTFVECAPKNVLSKMVEAILSGAEKPYRAVAADAAGNLSPRVQDE